MYTLGLSAIMGVIRSFFFQDKKEIQREQKGKKMKKKKERKKQVCLQSNT